MKMLLGMVLLITGCTKGSNPACEVGKIVIAPVTEFVAEQLECTGQDAMQKWAEAKLVEAKLCEKPTAQSFIGDIVCPSLVSKVVDQVALQIPADWKCKAATLKAEAKAKLLEVCRRSI